MHFALRIRCWLGAPALARMKFIVRLSQATARHVRVHFRGADSGVTQQLLDDAQIGPVLQQMCGEAMAQHMRRDISPNAGASNPVLYAKPKRYRSERRTAFREEYCGG